MTVTGWTAYLGPIHVERQVFLKSLSAGGAGKLVKWHLLYLKKYQGGSRLQPFEARTTPYLFNFDGDCLGLDFLCLWQRNGQDAILEVSLGLVGDDGDRQA